VISEYNNTLQKVLYAFGLEIEDFNKRGLRFIYARQIARYMLHQSHQSITHRQIAELTLAKDYSTVISSIRITAKQVKEKKEPYYLIEAIKQIEL
jgi:chromosomal replication initiation ATPase DnaA